MRPEGGQELVLFGASSTRSRGGQSIQFEYDTLNRVVTKTLGSVNTITSEYDLLGRLYRMTDRTGTTKNTCGKAGRVIRVEYPDSKTVSYQYDVCGNRTRLTYSVGIPELPRRNKYGGATMRGITGPDSVLGD